MIRIGHGVDSHRLEPGSGVTLGGVFIECPYRILAHSDGDVLIHALCDALLGACALGDIGKLFPDTDAKFKGADSRELLREVYRCVQQQGYVLGNADLTLIAQVPRVALHTAQMIRHIAADLAVESGRISIKATTAENMGALGRKEGIAAHAVVLVESRNSSREP